MKTNLDFLAGYKTKAGVIISSISPLLLLFGVEFDAESATQIVNELINGFGHILTAYGIIMWVFRELKKFFTTF